MDEAAVSLGRRGGFARAKALSKERCYQIALAAARQRWVTPQNTMQQICQTIDVRAIAARVLEQGMEKDYKLFLAAIYLISAIKVGVNAIRIAEFTGISRTQCVWFGQHARRMNIFKNGEVDIARLEGNLDEGLVPFILHCLVLTDQIRERRGMYSAISKAA